MTATKKTAIWTTKTGRQVRMCDMTESHIDAAMRMLQAAAQRDLDDGVGELMGLSSFITGEMASDQIERDLDRALTYTWKNLVADEYWELKREKERRRDDRRDRIRKAKRNRRKAQARRTHR